MNLHMESYYRIIDHYKGEICMLTSNRCDNGDCRTCVFAMEAYRQSLERKKEKMEKKDGGHILRIYDSRYIFS